MEVKKKRRLTRREFLKLGGAGLAVAALPGLGACAAPEDQIALGAWNLRVPWDFSHLDDYTAMVGRKPQVVLWYQGWTPIPDAFFGAGDAEEIYQRGHAQIYTWEPRDYRRPPDQPENSLPSILAGTHDAYIRETAGRIRDWGRLLYVRPMHEMNGDWYPWGEDFNGNNPDLFRQAWRRIHGIFAEEGAENVEWMWCPSVGPPTVQPTYTMSEYYPGDEYVDWLGLDGYNFADSRDMPWYTFEEVFTDSYEEITTLAPGKPLVICETASVGDGGDRARWIEEARTSLPSRFPSVEAFIWFNQDERSSRLRVDSTPDSLEAYRGLVEDSYFHGSLPHE